LRIIRNFILTEGAGFTKDGLQADMDKLRTRIRSKLIPQRLGRHFPRRTKLKGYKKYI